MFGNAAIGLVLGHHLVRCIANKYLSLTGTSQEHKCQFLPGKDGQVAVRDFRDHTLARIRDIEELAELGKKIGVCPYYAARPTIKPSEVRYIVLFGY